MNQPEFDLLFKNGCCIVIAGLTRNPVVAQRWIPDQSLPRARSGVRDDSCRVRDNSVFRDDSR